VERYITAPIEAAVQAVVGAASVESFSEEGRASVSIEVAPETDLATFIAEVNDRLARLHSTLPDRVRPFLTKDVPEALRDEQGFMTLQLVGPLPLEELRRLADRTVAPPLRSLPGLASVDLYGGAEEELRIRLDPGRMDALNIDPEVIRQRLFTALSDDVYGRLREEGRSLLLLRPPETRIESLRRLIVNESAAPIRLEDVAAVERAAAPVYSIARVDGEPVVTLVLDRAPGSHMLATSSAVMARLEELQSELPESVRLLVADDRTEAVRDQLRDLAWRGGMGLLLVVFVLVFMLKSVRATAVVLFSVAVALAVAFLLLAALDLTLNLLTLAGLVLVFGLLVDNSVVVVEQLQSQRRLARVRGLTGDALWEDATRETLRAVWLPLLGGTLTTMAVLLPLVYLSGELRALFLSFGILVCVTLGASLASAAWVVPAATRKLLPGEVEEPRRRRLLRVDGVYRFPARFPRLTLLVLALLLGIPLWLVPSSIEIPEDAWPRPAERLATLYNQTLGHASVAAAVDAAEPYLGGVLHPFSRKVNFGPAWRYEARPEVFVRLGFPTGNPIERADSLLLQFERVALASEAVAWTISRISEREAALRVQFTEGSLATSEPYLVRERLIQRAVLLGGVEVGVGGLLPEGYSSGYGGGGSGFTVEAYGPNYQDLEALSERFAERLRGSSRRVAEVNTNAGRYWRVEERELLRFAWDDRARILTGQSASTIAGQLRPILNTRFPMYHGPIEDEPRMAVRLIQDGAEALDVDRLVGLPLSANRTVKLGDAAPFVVERTPASIERKDQQYRRYIRVDYLGPYQMGQEFMASHLAAMPVPTGYRLEMASFSFFDDDVQESFFWVIVGTLALVFLITAAVFESWRLPAVVLLSVPLALIGVALGFLWSGANFAEGAFIGSVLLAGIAVNDSILLVDRYRQLRQLRPATSPPQLIRLAVRQRLRPMWTTTLTSVVSMLPLMVFPDQGDFWMGLAVTVTGGLLASTLLAPVATVAVVSLRVRRVTLR
jgi:multidrug efflux pump subunit AcrB